MPDIDLNEFRLPENAKKVVKMLDESIALFKSRERPQKQFRLYRWQWLVLDRVLRTQSDGKVSLKTHTYKGIKLVME